MRVPVELLVLACLRRRHRPGADGRTLPAHGGGLGARAGDARLQPGALARLQRAADDEPDRARPAARRSTSLLAGAAGRGARRGRRCCGGSTASASSSAASSRFWWRWPRALYRLARHRAAAAAAAHPGAARPRRRWRWQLWDAGLLGGPGRDAPISIRSFALLWLIGVACAVGAAWQAKFHRLAALTLLGGAGARHLRHLRLVLRARPRADAAAGRDRHHRAVPARPALAAQAPRADRPRRGARPRALRRAARPRARGRLRRRHRRPRATRC